ncbi:MAG TPA: SGNH/GDSL hydrolase family protein [Actinomycetota bacterium]|nr:SGNH/GDSL hydrolase family protein [Actinomycetota bacterium]
MHPPDEGKEPLRLVVLGDSTAFTNHVGPQLPGDPGLYPNVIARALERALDREVSVTVLARAGADSRDTWRVLYKDRHAQFEVLMGADAVVVAIGSIDHAPCGVPPVFEQIVPYIRPEWLRRRARRALHALHGPLTRLRGARTMRTPLPEFERLYDAVLFQVRALTQGVPGVVMGPTSHRSPYYGHVHPGRDERERVQFEIARRHGFAVVASWPLVQPHADRLNPDGIHWPVEAHADVGEALAVPLIAQLKGEALAPQAPRYEGWGSA